MLPCAGLAYKVDKLLCVIDNSYIFINTRAHTHTNPNLECECVLL